MTLKTVSRPRGTTGYVFLPRRWKAQRTLGWIMEVRLNVRDYERFFRHSEAHLTWSFVSWLTRRPTRGGKRRDWPRGPVIRIPRTLD